VLKTALETTALLVTRRSRQHESREVLLSQLGLYEQLTDPKLPVQNLISTVFKSHQITGRWI